MNLVGPFIGWRVEVRGTDLRLTKWGYPDRVWTFPLANYRDATASKLPPRLVFDEVIEVVRDARASPD